MRKLLMIALAATAIGAADVSTNSTQAFASDGGDCGWWAFAGAFKNRGSARSRARKVGGQVLDLDDSDSPNAGKGFWVVAYAATNRRDAQRAVRRYKRRGVSGAYAKTLCFY